MVEDLGKMTEADLRELGLPLGPRKRVLSAIEALTEQTTAVPEPHTPDVLSQEAERRQLTVMFCDLVGSTALSEALDAPGGGAVLAAHAEQLLAAASR